ncbi:unnamed protein product [Durusdinium trenchii]|uniref:Uncharacterized protein n=1 Tax=Durusdinium trenchii TaxID=1381693 RepID=A0ABP0JGX4_9DINO
MLESRVAWTLTCRMPAAQPQPRRDLGLKPCCCPIQTVKSLKHILPRHAVSSRLGFALPMEDGNLEMLRYIACNPHSTLSAESFSARFERYEKCPLRVDHVGA